MKRDPSELTWRLVRYRRSGIYRAQRLPRMWKDFSREEIEALAKKKNQEGIEWRARALARISREYMMLMRHAINGDRRASP